MKNTPFNFDFSPILPPLLSWIRAHRRALPWREDPTPYRVWISEIMLQQTRIEAVLPYYTRFLAELPDVKSLAECPEERLMKLWQGLGYYSRARNLKRAAEVIVRDFDGALPADGDALRALPGIGDYTAGAIASLAMGLPEPAVDGNVLRVLTRVSACGDDIAKSLTKKRFAHALREIYPTGEDARLFTEGLMELGQRLCIPVGTPLCEECPIAHLCEAHRMGDELCYPVKSRKAARKIQQRCVLLLISDGKIAIRKRPDKGLLAGLWELPAIEGEADADAVAAFLAGENLAHTGAVTPLGEAVHVFSHLEWHMTGLMIPVEGCAKSLTFASPEELREIYAIPSPFRKFLEETV